MLFTLFYYVYIALTFLLSFILLTPFYIIRLFGNTKAWKAFLQNYVSFWAKTAIFGTLSRIEVRGLENVPQGPVVIVGNHQSYFDILIIQGYVPKLAGFIAKKELSKIPILNGWMKRLHCIFINRKSLRDSYQTIEDGIQSLKQGNSLIIFPEGTRSRSAQMGRFKGGSFKLATLSGTPILPISIKDSYKIYEEKKKVHPGRVLLTIHPVINVTALSEEKKKDLPENISKIVTSAL